MCRSAGGSAPKPLRFNALGPYEWRTHKLILVNIEMSSSWAVSQRGGFAVKKDEKENSSMRTFSFYKLLIDYKQ
jgi:hypothetical protein